MTKPIKEYKVGGIKAAVFKHKTGNSVCLQKSYKKGKKWINHDIFLLQSDVIKAIEVLRKTI
jgi:hypothetical protein|tara:strand:+ start:186 stop:371 length:186 start_codon:yes stop_codon:yes gene_type:complete